MKVREGVKDGDQAPEEEDEGEGNEGEQENSGSRDKASSALIPPKKVKLKRKTKVKEETLDTPDSLESNETPTKGCPSLYHVYHCVEMKPNNFFFYFSYS